MDGHPHRQQPLVPYGFPSTASPQPQPHPQSHVVPSHPSPRSSGGRTNGSPAVEHRSQTASESQVDPYKTFEANLQTALGLSTALHKNLQQPSPRSRPPPASSPSLSPPAEDLLRRSEELRHSQNETLRDVILKHVNENQTLRRACDALKTGTKRQAELIATHEAALRMHEEEAEKQSVRIGKLEKEDERMGKELAKEKDKKEEAEAVGGGLRVALLQVEANREREEGETKRAREEVGRLKEELEKVRSEARSALEGEAAKTRRAVEAEEQERSARVQATEETTALKAKVQQLELDFANAKREKSPVPLPPLPPIVTSLKRKLSPSPSPAATDSPAHRRLAETSAVASGSGFSSSRSPSVDPGYNSGGQKETKKSVQKKFRLGMPPIGEVVARNEFMDFWLASLFRRTTKVSAEVTCQLCSQSYKQANGPPPTPIATTERVPHLEQKHAKNWEKIVRPGGMDKGKDASAKGG